MHSNTGTTLFEFRGEWSQIRRALHRARPLLALVGHDGIEHEAAEVVRDGDGWERGIATRVGPLHRDALGRAPRVLIEHPGPSHEARTLGYLSVLSEVLVPLGLNRVQLIPTSGRRESFTLSLDGVRSDQHLAWVRRGLSERPRELTPTTLILAVEPLPDTQEDWVGEAEEDSDLLAAGIPAEDFSSSSISQNYSVPAVDAVEHILSWRALPVSPLPLNSRLIVKDERRRLLATVERAQSAIARHASQLERQSSRLRGPLTALTPTGPYGALLADSATEADERGESEPPTQFQREARLVLADTSVVIAGLHPRHFHPDDRVVVSALALFDGAGSQSRNYWGRGQERITRHLKIARNFNALPLSKDAIYDLGNFLVGAYDRDDLNPELTRIDIYHALIATRYGAILKTCFPERYKGLMRGLKVEKY